MTRQISLHLRPPHIQRWIAIPASTIFEASITVTVVSTQHCTNRDVESWFTLQKSVEARFKIGQSAMSVFWSLNRLCLACFHCQTTALFWYEIWLKLFLKNLVETCKQNSAKTEFLLWKLISKHCSIISFSSWISGVFFLPNFDMSFKQISKPKIQKKFQSNFNISFNQICQKKFQPNFSKQVSTQNVL